MKRSFSMAGAGLLLMLLTGLFSCSGEGDLADATGSSWQITRIRKEGAVNWEKVDPLIRITFVSESLYILKLDANICEGDYRIFSGGNVHFTLSACTERCCDSPVAVRIHDMLPEMTRYEKKTDLLLLKGKGEMEMRKDE